MAETLWIDGPRRKSLDKAEDFRRKGRKSRWKKMQRIQISEDQGLTQEAKKRAKEKEDTSEDTTISVADQGVKEGAIDVEKALNFTGHLLRDSWRDTKEFKEWYNLPHNIGAVGARGIESFFTIDTNNPKEVALELIQKVGNPRKGLAGSIISEVPGVKQAINQLDEITQPIRTNIRTALTGPRLQPAYEAIGVQPRGILQQGVDDALGNNVFKVQLDDYVPGTGPLDAPVRSPNRTRLQRRGVSNQLLRDAGNTPEGMRRYKEALAYRNKHGSLKGYKETTTPWILPDGEEIIFRKTETGIKKSLKSDRLSAQTQRSTNELIQTHGKQDWNELFEGFTDPKQFPLKKFEGHHARMVEGYAWAFDGADSKTAKKITEHFFKKKIAFGKTQFNRNNLPHPVHKALHSWMDKQLGLNGLDMPSLTGMNAKQRIAHLEVYLEQIQPVVDEATFSLMKRYQQVGNAVDWTKPKAYKQLFLKNTSMADQFIDVNL